MVRFRVHTDEGAKTVDSEPDENDFRDALDAVLSSIHSAIEKAPNENWTGFLLALNAVLAGTVCIEHDERSKSLDAKQLLYGTWKRNGHGRFSSQAFYRVYQEHLFGLKNALASLRELPANQAVPAGVIEKLERSHRHFKGYSNDRSEKIHNIDEFTDELKGA